MNRSVVQVGAALALVGLGLLAFPIVTTGGEQFDVEQEAGFLVGPLGLAVVAIGGVADDPTRTTVGGLFGNPEETAARSPRSRTPEKAAGRTWNPHEPVDCRYCRTVITPDLARCPRCSRARDCRSCGRPLGAVLDRPTCPRCAQPESLCNCARFTRPAAGVAVTP